MVRRSSNRLEKLVMPGTRDLNQEIQKTLGLAHGLEQALRQLAKNRDIIKDGETLREPGWMAVQAMVEILADRLEDMQELANDETHAAYSRLTLVEKVADVVGTGLPNR
jgi:hypothetical protein